MTSSAPPVAAVHTPPAWMLDNPLRRLLSPPRKIVDRLGPRPGDRLVDLGAGVGFFDEELLARIGPSGRLTLVDVNGAWLASFAQRHGPDPRLETLVASATSVPSLESGRMDRAFLNMVLCDIPDQKGVVEETWRVLRPGGVAYFSFHSTDRPNPSRPLWLTPQAWKAATSTRAWTLVGNGGRWGGKPWFLLRRPSG